MPFDVGELKNVQDRVSSLGSNIEGDDLDDLTDFEIEPLTYNLPEGQELEDALQRLKLSERRLFAEIEAIENHLKTHKNIKLARQLPGLRRQWLETSKAATAVWRVLKSMDAGNELQTALTAADQYIHLILDHVFYMIRTFPPKFTGTARLEALKHTSNLIDKCNALIPNAFAKSGLEDLQQRAFDLVTEKAKSAEKQLEKDHALEFAELRKLQGTI